MITVGGLIIAIAGLIALGLVLLAILYGLGWMLADHQADISLVGDPHDAVLLKHLSHDPRGDDSSTFHAQRNTETGA